MLRFYWVGFDRFKRVNLSRFKRVNLNRPYWVCLTVFSTLPCRHCFYWVQHGANQRNEFTQTNADGNHFFISKGSFFPIAANQLQMETEIVLVGDVDWNMARDCDTQVALQVFDGGVVEFVRER